MEPNGRSQGHGDPYGEEHPGRALRPSPPVGHRSLAKPEQRDPVPPRSRSPQPPARSRGGAGPRPGRAQDGGSSRHGRGSQASALRRPLLIVVDTNVVAYLYLSSDHTAAAEETLRKDPEWVAPLLWRSEMRNILALYVRQRLLA